MAVTIDRMFVDVRARSDSARAREVVSVLPDRLRENIGPAFAQAGLGDGAMFVPRLRVELSVDLGKTSGDELARAIARECTKALNELGETTTNAEIAAWLLARLHGLSTASRHRSLEREFSHVSVASAFVTLLQRAPSPTKVIALLSDDAIDDIVRRCSENEAATILRRLDDQREPDPQTWQIVEAIVRERELHVERAPCRTALAGCMRAVRVDAPGAKRAAVTLVVASRRERDPSDHEPAWVASHCTGLWLLLPALTKLLRDVEEHEARAQALGVAVLLAGEDALDDPALRSWAGERGVEAAEPNTCRRLAVAAIREVARRLTYFEGARCTYLLRTVFSGPGMVRGTAAGWEATLPRSPLRVVLDRAGLLGPLATPWPYPLLRFVREPGK